VVPKNKNGAAMAIEPPCDCLDYQDQLTECKQEKHKNCEERSKEQSNKISRLEKKIMTMTIIGAISVTLIGKEMVDKVVASFSFFKQTQNSLLQENKNDTKNSNNNTSTNPLSKPE